MGNMTEKVQTNLSALSALLGEENAEKCELEKYGAKREALQIPQFSQFIFK